MICWKEKQRFRSDFRNYYNRLKNDSDQLLMDARN